MVDPVTGWTLAKTVADATKKLYEVAKGLKDYETKQKLDEVLDELRDLKQEAANLEDQNRDLREKLRFKTDEFKFENPFWYHNAHRAQPFCPKCFAKNIAAPMSEQYEANGQYRRCLVCETNIRVDRLSDTPPKPELRQVGAVNYYFVGDKGPYCQPCYDGAQRLTALTPPQRWNSGIRRHCVLCKEYFHEQIMGSEEPAFGIANGPDSWMGN